MQRFISILIVILLAFVASTRIPESDLINYLNNFQGAKTLDFIDFIFFQAKDPFFNILTYLLAMLDLESSQYIFVLSFIFYILMYKISNSLSISPQIKMMFFLSLAFNPVIFSLHIHLLRQFIGLSFFIYSITLINDKYKLPFKIMSVLTHFSFIVIQAIMRLITNIRDLIIVVSLVLIVFIFKNALESVPIIGYLLARSSGEYLDFDKPSFGSLIFSFVMSIFIIYNLLNDSKLLSKEFKNFSWSILILFFGSVFFSTELFYRVFPILLILSHFVFLEFSKKLKFPEKLKFKPYAVWIPINIILFVLLIKSWFIGQWSYNLFSF